jgi:hypothetical protein
MEPSSRTNGRSIRAFVSLVRDRISDSANARSAPRQEGELKSMGRSRETSRMLADPATRHPGTTKRGMQAITEAHR